MLAAAGAKSRGRMCCFCGGTDMRINAAVFWNFSGRCKVGICTAELSAWLVAQPCSTASPPDPLARGNIPPKMSEVLDGTDGGCLHCRVALGTFILHT